MLTMKPLIALSLLLGTTFAEMPAALQPLIEHVRTHPDGQAMNSLNFAALKGDRSGLPIGVFDSGIGGLTVLEAILKLDAFNNATLAPGADGVPDFAGERFIYLGDQANMPYGNYAAKGRLDFLKELIVRDAVFLLGQRYRASQTATPSYDKPPVKAIVIACNTATAYGIEDIRAALKSWQLDVPVIGVVEAGARAVNDITPSEGKPGTVAVLATLGTCSSGAYPRAIGQATGLAGKPAAQVIQQGSVGMAGAIEGQATFASPATDSAAWVDYKGPAVGNTSAPLDPALAALYGFDFAGVLGHENEPSTWKLNSVANYVRYDVATLVESYRKAGGGPPISSVVLGCTHFPLVAQPILEAFARLRDYEDAQHARPYHDLIAQHVEVVDPAHLTAKELFRELARAKLRSPNAKTAQSIIGTTFYLSEANAQWPGSALVPGSTTDLTDEYKYGRNPGQPEREDTVYVPMKVERVPGGLSKALPLVGAALARVAK